MPVLELEPSASVVEELEAGSVPVDEDVSPELVDPWVVSSPVVDASVGATPPGEIPPDSPASKLQAEPAIETKRPTRTEAGTGIEVRMVAAAAESSTAGDPDHR